MPFGIQSSEGKEVYAGESWFDGRPCIVLDYSKTSLLAKSLSGMRFREALHSLGVYLGKVYLGKMRLIHFMIDFGRANGWGANVGLVRMLAATVGSDTLA